MTAGTHHNRRRSTAVALGLAGTLALAACASPGGQNQHDPVVERPASDASAASNLARSLNDAGFRIFHTSLADGENTAVSPLSIGLAFGMLDAGATGSVADALDHFFAYPASGDARLRAFNSLDLLASSDPSTLPKPGKGEPDHAIVTVANRIFTDANFAPADAYRADLSRYFGAGVQTEPLATDGEKSAKDINAWVDKRTNGLIPTLVDAGFFNSDSRLTLVNTLYMKAKWQSPFDANATFDEPFTLTDGSAVDVPMMHSGRSSGEVAEGDNYVAVSLPYAYDELEMTVIVPDDGAFASVQEGLDQQWLDGLDASATPREYDLALPKFTTTTSVDLAAAMEAAGAKGLFGVVGLDGIGPELYVSGAVHATKVIVDEAGTEAAAATAIGLAGSAAPTDPPLSIRADHPFLYVIRDTDTGAVLFVGRELDPR